MESDRSILQVKVCSARKLPATCNAFVVVECGGWTRQTSVKKHSDKPIWNETFALPVDEENGIDSERYFKIHLRNKDSLGKIQELGTANVALPHRLNELSDIWVVLDASTSNTDVHLCMQLEPLAGRSLDILVQRQSSRPSLMRFGSSSLKLFGAISADTTESPKSSISSKTPEVSTFGVKAGAVTLTEICQSLDRLRTIIYLAGTETVRDADERVEQLQKAKVELDDLEDQVDEVEGLSEEWRNKLGALIADYAKDCWKMLSDESWERLTKKRLSKAPPPLPSRDEMARIRKSVVVPPSNGSQESSSPKASPGSVSSRQGQETASISIVKRPHTVTVREHFVGSLEAFDSMMDFGFAVEYPKKNVLQNKGICARAGDIARFKLTSFIYDAISCKAISYDGPSQVELVIGGALHPDVPRGLVSALETVPHGSKEVIVTVAPEWGFGDDGHANGVPPNSTLIFELLDVAYTPGDVETLATLQVAEDEPRIADSSLGRMFSSFPAREPEVILTTKGSTLPKPPTVAPPAPPKRSSLLRTFASSPAATLTESQSGQRAKDNISESKQTKGEPKQSTGKGSPKYTLRVPEADADGNQPPPSLGPVPPKAMLSELNVRLSRRSTHE